MHQQPRLFNPVNGLRHRSGWWVLAIVALAALLAAAMQADHRASGAGTLVVIEDVSHLGSGSFSGNVCYQVVRDRDGVTVSEGCFSIATTIAAPDDLDTTTERYTIVIFLADANCVLLDDPRSGTGASPFYVRVSCDAAYMTATASAGGGALGGDDASVTETPAVELTAWPPVYDPPTVVIIGGAETTTVPLASPIPMAHPDNG